jgi:hypothetical protein
MSNKTAGSWHLMRIPWSVQRIRSSHEFRRRSRSAHISCLMIGSPMPCSPQSLVSASVLHRQTRSATNQHRTFSVAWNKKNNKQLCSTYDWIFLYSLQVCNYSYNYFFNYSKCNWKSIFKITGEYFKNYMLYQYSHSFLIGKATTARWTPKTLASAHKMSTVHHWYNKLKTLMLWQWGHTN